MLHRLPPSTRRKPDINEIQPDIHPLEVLYDVKKLTDPQNVTWIFLHFIKDFIMEPGSAFERVISKDCASYRPVRPLAWRTDRHLHWLGTMGPTCGAIYRMECCRWIIISCNDSTPHISRLPSTCCYRRKCGDCFHPSGWRRQSKTHRHS